MGSVKLDVRLRSMTVGEDACHHEEGKGSSHKAGGLVRSGQYRAMT